MCFYLLDKRLQVVDVLNIIDILKECVRVLF